MILPAPSAMLSAGGVTANALEANARDRIPMRDGNNSLQPVFFIIYLALVDQISVEYFLISKSICATIFPPSLKTDSPRINLVTVGVSNSATLFLSGANPRDS